MKNEQLKIKIKKVILSPKSGRNPEKIRKKIRGISHASLDSHIDIFCKKSHFCIILILQNAFF